MHDGTSKIAAYSFAPPANEWFHVGATMDFQNDEYKIYYNGNDVSAAITEGEIKSVVHTSDSDFNAGTLNGAVVSGGGVVISKNYMDVSHSSPDFNSGDRIFADTSVKSVGGVSTVVLDKDAAPVWAIKEVASPSGIVGGVHAVDADTIYVSHWQYYLYFYKSTDGGNTWTQKQVDGSGNVGPGNSIYAVNKDTIFISYYDQDNTALKFAKSTDGGNTWTANIVDNTGTVGMYTSIYAVDGDKIFISYQDIGNQKLKFAKSTDGGNTWAIQTIPSSSGGTHSSIQASDASNIFISYLHGGPSVRLAKSTNGGNSWSINTIATSFVGVGSTSLHIAGNTLFVSYLRDTTGSAEENLMFTKSTDWGSTWVSPIKVHTDYQGATASYTGHDSSLYALDASKIFISFTSFKWVDLGSVSSLMFAKSTDGGATWNVQSLTDEAYTEYGTSLYAVDENNILIGYPSYNYAGKGFAKFAKPYKSSGAFTSSGIDAGQNSDFTALQWVENNPPGTDINFQLAANNDNSVWNFVGPGGNAGSYYTAPGEAIWSGHNGNRYMKYKAYFSTTDGLKTPVLSGITISYNYYSPLSSLISSSIDTNADRSDFTDISWNADTPPGTSVKFQLASSPDGITWSDFMGPSGAGSYFTDSSGQAIPASFDGNRYIKYQAFLETSDASKTPKLNDITIRFKALPSIKTVGATGAIGASNAAADKSSWDGLLDETMVWGRILSSEEFLEHYKRGALDLYLEVRSCDDPDCSGESFIGHYIQQGVNAIDVPNNRYFQYRVNLATEDDNYSPALEDIKLSYTVT